MTLTPCTQPRCTAVAMTTVDEHDLCERHAREHRLTQARILRQAGLQPCGTRAAYKRHLRNRELPCQACLDAAAEDQRQRRARQRDVA